MRLREFVARSSCRPAFLLAGLSLGGVLAFFWWSARHNPNIAFLPKINGAEWVVYPTPPAGEIHERLNLSTAFGRSFTLTRPPKKATIRIAGFRDYSLTVNGVIASLAQPETNWKQPRTADIAGLLRAGENSIQITVLNSNGPPALWLWLGMGDETICTGRGEWTASIEGSKSAEPRWAKLSAEPRPGNSLFGGETLGQAFQARWPLLVSLCLGMTVLCLVLPRLNPRTISQVRPWGERLIISVLVAAWIGLFADNLGVLPAGAGYDSSGHLAYVDYIQKRGALPLANEGWEMFQPPLYYVVSAGLLNCFGLTARQAGGVTLLRWFGFVIGVAHCLLVLAALKIIFPGDVRKRSFGLVIAGCLPPVIYLSQYVTNEGLSACLVSAAVYLALRILQSSSAPLRAFAYLGACVGAALLTKVTAILFLPVLFGALLFKFLANKNNLENASDTKPGRLALQMLVTFGTCLVVCGWHYGRVWLRFGTPVMGVWDPRSGFSWWQDPGYHTSQFFLTPGSFLIHPWFSAFNTFCGGIYSTLWGEGLMGGASDFLLSPAWNYDLMILCYCFALVPALLVIAGSFLSLRLFLRKPTPLWFLLLGLAFLLMVSVAHMTLTVPYYCTVKAFYALAGLVPFCAVAAAGFGSISRTWLRNLSVIALGMWAILSLGSFWIIRGSDAQIVKSARALAWSGDYDQATRLLKEQSDSPDKNQLLAEITIATGDLVRARDLAQLSVNACPHDPARHVVLGIIETRQNLVAEAATEFQKAMALAPESVAARTGLARLLIGDHKYKEASEIAREGLSLAPASLDLHHLLSTSLLGAGTVAQAIEAFKETTRLYPDDPTALNDLAWVMATTSEKGLRNGAHAVLLSEHACSLTGYREPQLIGTLAAAYAEAGRFPEAVATAERAQQVATTLNQPEVAEKNRQLAEVYRVGKAYREATSNQ